MWRILSKAYLGWDDLLSQVKTMKKPAKTVAPQANNGNSSLFRQDVDGSNIQTCGQASEVHMWDAMGLADSGKIAQKVEAEG